jgi:hypothetical protein
MATKTHKKHEKESFNTVASFALKVSSTESASSGRLKIAQRFIAGIGREPRRSP